MSGIIAQNVGRHGGLIKAVSGGGGAWTLIQTLTSDGSDSDLSFTSGLDSTYDEYIFLFNNLHAETLDAFFLFNFSDDGGSSYAVTKTSVAHKAVHSELDDYTQFGYDAGYDLAQDTADQKITMTNRNGADDSWSGWFQLFAPSDTTYVKHWLSRTSCPYDTSAADFYTQGYGNTTSAIDAITFKMSSGEIQGGSISMYGIS